MRIVLFSMLFLFVVSPVYAQVPEKPMTNTHVYDYANVIDDAAEAEMRLLIQQIEEETTNQIVLMTIDTIGEMEAFEFGQQVIRQWGIGQQGKNNGMFIFTTTDQGEGNNDVWISVGQGLGGAFPDGKLGRIIDYYMLTPLMDGDFTLAFEDVLTVIGQEMRGEIADADPGEPNQLVGLLAFGAVVFVMLGGLMLIWILRRRRRNRDEYDPHYANYSDDRSSDSGFGGGDSDGGGAGRNF